MIDPAYPAFIHFFLTTAAAIAMSSAVLKAVAILWQGLFNTQAKVVETSTGTNKHFIMSWCFLHKKI